MNNVRIAGELGILKNETGLFFRERKQEKMLLTTFRKTYVPYADVERGNMPHIQETARKVPNYRGSRNLSIASFETIFELPLNPTVPQTTTKEKIHMEHL